MDKLVEIDAQLLTSVAFLAVTFAAGECFRYLIKKTYPDEEDLTRMYVMEIEMQFERIVTAFETVFGKSHCFKSIKLAERMFMR